MRQDLHSPNIFDAILKSARFSHARKILNEDFTVTVNGALVNFLDPNGADRDVTLPIREEGLFYTIANVGAANNLLVKDSGGNLLSTVQPGQTVELWASEEEWQGSKATSDLDVFTNTVDGLVPAPNSVSPGSLFLRDDGQWGQVQVVGIVDAFKYITDGTNVATGAGPDTFKIWSPDGSLSILVTNNEVTHGDNVRLEVDEANVDHNALLNYVSDQHVPHSSISVVAGYGLSGGGTIDGSIQLDFDDTELTPGVVGLSDYAVVAAAVGGSGRMLWTDVNSMLVHDNLTGFVSNEHIDHSTISMIAGVGLSGGGDLTTSRTFNLDFTELETGEAVASDDLIPFYDMSEGDHNTTPFLTFNASLDHDILINFVGNEHIDHSAVSISAGLGLTGGGNITATRTLAIDPTPATAALNVFTSLLKGLVPASGGGTTAFLRADGVFAIPSGGGDLLAINNLNDVANTLTAFNNIKGAATDSFTGVVELLTNAEARTGTDTTRALTAAAHVASHTPAFQTSTSGGQAIPGAGTWTDLVNLIDTGGDNFDSDACFASSRFTPNVAGYYYLWGRVSMPTLGSGDVGVGVAYNGSTPNTLVSIHRSGSGTATTHRAVSGILYFNGSTDYAELWAMTDWTAAGSFNNANFGGFRLFG